jgi:hypothetical protein
MLRKDIRNLFTIDLPSNLPRPTSLLNIKWRRRLLLDLFNTALWVIVSQCQALLRIHIKYCKVSDDGVHAFCACDREVAFLFDLWVAVFIAMGLSYHYLGLLGVGNEILNIGISSRSKSLFGDIP